MLNMWVYVCATMCDGVKWEIMFSIGEMNYLVKIQILNFGAKSWNFVTLRGKFWNF
jgi:hypothetical protein